MPAPTPRHPDYPVPRAPACPFDPPPALRALQAERPLTRVRLWDGSTAWLVTRHAEQRSLLADPRLSADTTLPHFPHRGPVQRELLQRQRPFIAMDDPEHALQRAMVADAFTVKRVETLRPSIQRVADDLIDELLARPAPVDLVRSFARPLPSTVICELLGVPYADHDFFQAKSQVLLASTTTVDQARAARRQLTHYLDVLLAERAAHPRGDLLSELATHVGAGELTSRAAATSGALLLVAGHQTTSNMIALGTLALLEHPDQRPADEPAAIAAAVEELLRYLSIVQDGRRRLALEDIPVGEHTIRAGEGVILATDLANRDPAAFPDGDRLDTGRDARGHLAFGFGAHRCLGQGLARVELQVALGTLFRRVPTLRLAAEPGRLRFKYDELLFGVHELPVDW